MSDISVLGWQPEEIEVLMPRPPMSSYEWATAHRVLSAETSQFSGRWSWDYVPFWAELADAWDDPAVRTIAVQKPSQSGYSELSSTLLGRGISEAPQPTMIVMPDRDSVERRIRTRIKPMFRASAAVRRHLPDGNIEAINSGQETILDNCILYIAWASSPAALADNPVCNLILDEVDKFPDRAGKEADPLSLAAKRQRTFLFAKTLIGSTPTDELGHIHRAVLAGDRRRYWIPCPHCHEYHVPNWGNVQLDHDADKHLLPPAAYAAGGHACYACPACGAAFADDWQRWDAVLAGVWAPDVCRVEAAGAERAARLGAPRAGDDDPRTPAASYRARRDDAGKPDAAIVGPIPITETRSYLHPGALALHPAFSTVDRLAAAWASAQIERRAGRIGPLMDFVNSELAEIWQETAEATDADKLAAHVEANLPSDLVPRGARCLTAGLDVQKDHIYLDVWAWGYLYECWLVSSQRLEIGMTDYLPNWTPVTEALARRYPWQTLEGEAEDPAPLPISLTFVDSGFNTDVVYDYCRLTGGIDVRPTKGADRQDVPYRSSVIEYSSRTGRAVQRSVRLWLIAVEQYKDRAARLLGRDEPGPGYAHLNGDTNADTLRQLTSEHKRIHRDSHGRTRMLWQVKPGQTDNHRWDTFVAALAAAEVLGVRNVPPPGSVPPPADNRNTTRVVGRMGGGR